MELVSINTKLIASGGHSVIYQDFNQPFVRKTYSSENIYFVNWLQEVGCLRLLRKSPFTIDYFKLGKDILLPNYDYNLSQFLFKYKPSLKTRINIFYQILRGVSEIHNKGFIHRDLKLHNIMINKDNLNTVIIDFGWCCQGYIDNNYLQYLDKDHPQVNKICDVSTLPYKAPELNINFPSKNKSFYYDNKIDIWSIGIIGIELFFNNMSMHGSFNQYKHWGLIIKNFSSYTIEEINKNPELINIYTPINKMCFRQYYQFPNELICILNGMLQINPENRCNIWDILNHIFFREIYEDKLINIPKKLDIISFFDERFNCIPSNRTTICDLIIQLNVHPKCYFDIVKMYDLYINNATKIIYNTNDIIDGIYNLVTILNYNRTTKINQYSIDIICHILKTINYQIYNATPYDYLMAIIIDLNIDPKMIDNLVSILIIAIRGSLDSYNYKKLAGSVIKYVFKDTLDLQLINKFCDNNLLIKLHELVLDYEK
jgi:serine/threonine protein kinase